MIEEIASISHPLLRTIAAGALLSSLVTIPLAVAAPLAQPIFKYPEESANRSIVYAAGISAVLGSALGLRSSKRKNQPSSTRSAQPNPSSAWNDWREFTVVQKSQESEGITSFYLKPKDGQALTSFKPGQFLTIKLDIPGQLQPVIRTYSLSDYAIAPDYYRLSIKRELAPRNSIAPPGLASNFMHDHISAGAIILAKPPAGKFFLDVESSRPIVLISNGVGITPMISMAKAASILHPQRHVWFVHGARDSLNHALQAEVNALAADSANLHVINCYSQPLESDRGHYQHQGYVDMTVISEVVAPAMQTLCGSSTADYYLCGSPAFMDSLREGLRTWKVPDSQVFFESFTKAKPKTSEIPQPASSPQQDSRQISFTQSAKTLEWNSGHGTILEFAEAHDIYPDYSCRAGVCGTCMCKILDGEVDYEEPPTAQVDDGSVLICISRPKTAKVVLEL